VSWTIDKVTIIDSFGKFLSVCKKGLSLESGQPVYLPLYSGECNIPLDIENSTSSSVSKIERMMVDEKQQQRSIGPFTKEQNYEAKDLEYMEIISAERTAQRGLGPFTKEQNLGVAESERATNYDDAKERHNVANPWIVLDISSDGDSNSLENAESEHGRSFSGAINLIYRTPTAVEHVVETTLSTTTNAATTAATEFPSEIQEPVLRANKKETGRSLKLPEITEPILRPRGSRQNTRNEVVPQHEKQHDEIQMASSTSTRAFTVQFLPERLASILAQAERYARQTLLPFISQYTPSFMTGMRHDEPKYFRLLGDVTQPKNTDSSIETSKSEITNRRWNGDQIAQMDIAQRKSKPLEPKNEEEIYREESVPSMREENDQHRNRSLKPKNETPPIIVEAVYPEKTANTNLTDLETRTTMTTEKTRREDGDWRAIGERAATSSRDAPPRRDPNASRSLDRSIEHDQISQTASAKMDTTSDWVPITIKSNVVAPTTMRTWIEDTGAIVISLQNDDVDEPQKSVEDKIFKTKEEAVKKEAATTSTYERKFIPLIDLEETTSSSTSIESNNVVASTTIASHIQKIPRYKETTVKNTQTVFRSTMMFPYAYERRNDLRTRYIPLIPEEDMGKSYSFMERDR